MPLLFAEMFSLSKNANTPTIDEEEVAADPDEPPDRLNLRHRPSLASCRSSTLPPPYYAKTKTVAAEGKKESLLTRALLSSPDLYPVNATAAKLPPVTSLPGLAPSSNRNVPSIAGLTSGSETTTPSHSRSPSPPQQYKLPSIDTPTPKPLDTGELQVEAGLGRKRCITFACGRKLLEEEKKASSEPLKETPKVGVLPRKSALTFACPARPSTDTRKDDTTPKAPSTSRLARSPAPPTSRKSSQTSIASLESLKAQTSAATKVSTPEPNSKPTGISDAVRYHEFGSESDDDDWVNQDPDYGKKMTMNDCMQKEIAIRKLGEEVEEEAKQDEEDYDEDDDDDDDEDIDDEEDEDDEDNDDEDDGDDGDDVSNADDGNESDNEAGFASSDDESDDSTGHGFWTPRIASGDPSDSHKFRRIIDRRNSTTSVESHCKSVTPVAVRPRRISKPAKPPKFRPGTPTLPDSTDFVCGTLDEDAALENAYISCMEERRRSKHVPIPQDIDPSFPRSDDDDDEEEDANKPGTRSTSFRAHSKASGLSVKFNEDCMRGRPKDPAARKTTPNHSPKRLQSPPPPRRLFGRSPRRLRSPPPPGRLRSPPPTRRTSVSQMQAPGPHLHFPGLAQRPRIHTSSLPRTPNPFFARLAHHRTPRTASISPVRLPRRRNNHTRGAIDIVAGLEKKREKRKEKFWRQHCRKAAKEQLERKKPLCGKGAERMRELGLEVAERFKAYNVINDPQLVLSV